MTNSIDDFSLLGVQKAIDRLERKFKNATSVSVNTANFNHNLTAADDTIQKALDTIDDLNFVLPPDIDEFGTSEAYFQINDASNGPRLVDDGAGNLLVMNETGLAPVDVLANQYTDITGNTFDGQSTTSNSLDINDGSAPLAEGELVLSDNGGTGIRLFYDAVDDTVKLTRDSSGTTDEVVIESDLISDNVVVDASEFGNNLDPTDTDIQTALETIDLMVGGAGSSIYDEILVRNTTLIDASWTDVNVNCALTADRCHNYTLEVSARSTTPATKDAAYATYKIGIITDAATSSFVGQAASDTTSPMIVVAMNDGDDSGSVLGFEMRAILSGLGVQFQARATLWTADTIIVRARIGVVRDT